MSLKAKIKSAKPREKQVVVDGDTVLVRGLTRVRKNELVNKCQKAGKMDSDKLEAALLSECVFDPSDNTLLMSDPNDWDVPSHIAGPLVKACIEVCGFDDDEARQLEKKSEATESLD